MATINKAELINEIAEKSNISKKDSKVILESILSSIQDNLVNGISWLNNW